MWEIQLKAAYAIVSNESYFKGIPEKRDPVPWEDLGPRTLEGPRTLWGSKTPIIPPIKYSVWLKYSKILHFI